MESRQIQVLPHRWYRLFPMDVGPNMAGKLLERFHICLLDRTAKRRGKSSLWRSDWYWIDSPHIRLELHIGICH